MTELELIIDLHINSERQGPGSEKDMLKALAFLKYPEIDTASNKIKQVEDNGYTLEGYFYLD